MGHALTIPHDRGARVWQYAFSATLFCLGGMVAMWFLVLPQTAGAMFARVGAVSALTGSVVAAMIRRTQGRRADHAGALSVVLHVAELLALLAGVVAATILSIALGTRLVLALIELWTLVPASAAERFGFGPEGAVSLALLIPAAGLSCAVRRRRSLLVATVLLIGMTGTWMFLLPTVYEITAALGIRKTWASLALMGWLSCMIGAVSILGVVPAVPPCDRAYRGVQDLGGRYDTGLSTVRWLLGLHVMAALLLAGYQLAVPVEPVQAGLRAGFLATAIACVILGSACLRLARRLASGNLADAGLGAYCLAAAALGAALVPHFPTTMSERYPVLFNALMVALACCAGIFAWMIRNLSRAERRGGSSASAFSLAVHLKRAAFLSGVMALTLAGLMAFWPRLREVGTPDFSLGRVTAGFGGNLVLLLAMLWCARTIRRPTFHIMTLLALGTSAGFMFIRMLPYTPRFG